MFQLNGNAYGSGSGRDPANGGWRLWWEQMFADYLADAAAVTASASSAASSAADAQNYAAALVGTSTTSLTIGTGSKSLTTQTLRQFAAGQQVRILRTSDPTKYMDGQVASYTSGTGAFDVTVESVNGAGTFTDWTIVVGGKKGDTGATGAAGAGMPAFTAPDALKVLGINAAGTAAALQTMPFRNIQIFTIGGTFTPDANNLSNKYLIVLIAGGASGARGTLRGGQAGSVIFGICEITSAQTVTIGGGGAAVTADSTAGNAGTDSSIGTLAVAKGGAGGNTAPQSSDGTVPTGCIAMRGESSITEAGGSSFLSGALMSVSGAKLSGHYGSGGQAAANGTTTGAGGDGICLIIW